MATATAAARGGAPQSFQRFIERRTGSRPEPIGTSRLAGRGKVLANQNPRRPLLENLALPKVDHKGRRPKRTPEHHGQTIQNYHRDHHPAKLTTARCRPADPPTAGRVTECAAMAMPPFFYYANALKYLASAAAAAAILSGALNYRDARAEALTLQWSVLVLIGFKWIAAAAHWAGVRV